MILELEGDLMFILLWLFFLSGMLLVAKLYNNRTRRVQAINISSLIFSAIILFFLAYMLCYPSISLNGASSGLKLWFNSVIPSLLPFLILSDILIQTDFIFLFGKLLSPFMRLLFNISGSSSIALILGMISGYPVGAKISCELYDGNVILKDEAQRLLYFTNNCGPMFILGTVAIGMYGIKELGILLLISHYAGSISIGILTGIISRKSKSNKYSYRPRTQNQKASQKQGHSLGEIISDSIKKSTDLILVIGGFIILFSVLIETLKHTIFLRNNVFSCFLLGSFEMTNGVYGAKFLESSLLLKAVLSSFVIGFGGLSITLQTLTLLKNTDLKIKNYIFAKIIHGIFSSIFCLLLYGFFINDKIISTYTDMTAHHHTSSISLISSNSSIYHLNIICLISIAFVVFIVMFKKLRKFSSN
jgi:sporulation integral membrane protein YlbJ